MPRTVEFNVEQGDILSFKADVVALKYAQEFYGADMAVAKKIAKFYGGTTILTPQVGKYGFVESRGEIQAPFVFFMGVVDLWEFRYQQIREFSIAVLKALEIEAPSAKHIAMTVHGPGSGLDESEAIKSQLAGCIEAIQTGKVPPSLERISFVERNEDRVKRFRKTVETYLASADYAFKESDRWAYRVIAQSPESEEPQLRSSVEEAAEAAQPGIASEKKPHAFIAMPFKKEFEDIFYYGIQQPVQSAGLLCERVDKTEFTGGIMDYVRDRIETASVVIAELTGANPNVYLEVGYAWGHERPVIMLAANEKELQFDIQGQRCLTYTSIKELESALGKELKGMITKGIITL